MANVKKGQNVPSPQWWKHLRDWKRFFWKKQRKADKRSLSKLIGVRTRVQARLASKPRWVRSPRAPPLAGRLTGKSTPC